MSQYHKMKAASYVIVRNTQGEILLMRRANTGYMDGKFGLPSGHVEQNESFVAAAVRELREETGLKCTEEDMEHRLTLHRYQESGEHDYVDIFFEVTNWQGKPKNTEPHKCSELIWTKPVDSKHEMVDYLYNVFQEIEKGIRLFESVRGSNE
jgi:8-oxo-dGTP diphosphatase